MGGMDDLYREQILEHHRRPHNQGTLTAPSVSLEGRNPNCGDVINLQLQLDEAGIITDVAFMGRGCAISQAGTSLITDELRGKSAAEILALTSPFVMELLGVGNDHATMAAMSAAALIASVAGEPSICRRSHVPRLRPLAR